MVIDDGDGDDVRVLLLVSVLCTRGGWCVPLYAVHFTAPSLPIAAARAEDLNYLDVTTDMNVTLTCMLTSPCFHLTCFDFRHRHC